MLDFMRERSGAAPAGEKPERALPWNKKAANERAAKSATINRFKEQPTNERRRAKRGKAAAMSQTRVKAGGDGKNAVPEEGLLPHG